MEAYEDAVLDSDNYINSLAVALRTEREKNIYWTLKALIVAFLQYC